MKNVFQIIGAVALVAGFSVPALADGMADASKLTCKDMMAMDSAGMMAAGTSINMMAQEKAKTDSMMKQMTDEEAMKAAEAACKAHPDMMVTEAMQANM